jgi:hypothetical protein
MNIKIGVFSVDQKSARYKFSELINNMKYGEVKKVVNTSNRCYALLKDGTEYYALVASDIARGHHFNKIYEDTRIGFGEHRTVVLPSLFPFPDGSKPVIEYYS